MGQLTDTTEEVQEALDQELSGDPSSTVGWDDLKFPANAVARGPTGVALVDFKGGEVLEFSNTGAPVITFVAQVPHACKSDTDLVPHIHFTLPTSGAGAGVENIKFDLTYSWAEIGASFPTETTTSLTGDVQDSVADNHSYAGFSANVLNSNKAENGGQGVSSMLICSMTRDNAVANNYADAVLLLEFDFHYQIDQPRGSRQEFVK